MSNQNSPKPLVRPPGGSLMEIVNYFKLIWLLLADERVSPFLKLLPLGSLAYVLWPLDIPGPVDDVAALGGALWMFVELCPPDVVEEHRKTLRGVVDLGAGAAKPPNSAQEDDVIDAEVRDL
ncbi:MAG: hypothetical protein OHK0052_23940 [Anaerolineales bacterium]